MLEVKIESGILLGQDTRPSRKIVQNDKGSCAWRTDILQFLVANRYGLALTDWAAQQPPEGPQKSYYPHRLFHQLYKSYMASMLRKTERLVLKSVMFAC